MIFRCLTSKQSRIIFESIILKKYGRIYCIGLPLASFMLVMRNLMSQVIDNADHYSKFSAKLGRRRESILKYNLWISHDFYFIFVIEKFVYWFVCMRYKMTQTIHFMRQILILFLIQLIIFYKHIFDMYNCFMFYRKNPLNNSCQLLSRQ